MYSFTLNISFMYSRSPKFSTYLSSITYWAFYVNLFKKQQSQTSAKHSLQHQNDKSNQIWNFNALSFILLWKKDSIFKNIFQILWLLILKLCKWHHMLQNFFHLKGHVENNNTLLVFQQFWILQQYPFEDNDMFGHTCLKYYFICPSRYHTIKVIFQDR